MTTEQDKTLEALSTAIQMEIDGKAFYLEASQQSNNDLGKKLLKSLASEEDIHRQKFEKVYDSIRNRKEWPDIDFQPNAGMKLRTLLSTSNEEKEPRVNINDTELNALQTAMRMENKTYDYYESQSKSATYDAEKEFYKALAAEERGHHQVLLDYYEYLKDPSGWLVTKEHPSLDGG